MRKTGLLAVLVEVPLCRGAATKFGESKLGESELGESEFGKSRQKSTGLRKASLLAVLVELPSATVENNRVEAVNIGGSHWTGVSDIVSQDNPK